MKRSGLLLMLLAACLRLCAAGPSADREGVTFRYHPTDTSLTLIDTEVRTESERMEGAGESETSVTVTMEKTKTHYAKTAKGYTITAITLSVRKAVDGVEVEPDSFDRAFMAVPLSVELNRAGRPIAFKGFDKLREKLLELAEDEEERAYYEKLLTEKQMEMMAWADWAATNGILLGLTKRPGDTWKSKIKWYLFSPSLSPVTTEYTFVRMANVAGRTCAMLKNVISPDLKVAEQDLAKILKEVELLPEEMDTKCSVLAYREEYIRYIDPTTFLTWKSTESITKKFKITLDGVDLLTTVNIESTVTTEVGEK